MCNKTVELNSTAGVYNVEISNIHHEIMDNNTGGTKRVIVKFVNRKHSGDMLRLKKIIGSRSKVFISNSLCLYYRYLWSKREDLQRRGIFNQVFCLGVVVTIKASENGPPVKIYRENDLKVYQDDINIFFK